MKKRISFDFLTNPFYPITVFACTSLFYSWILGQVDWKQAFVVGGMFAIIQLAYSWYKEIDLDYIAVGTDFFLINGAAGFLAFPALLAPYSYFMQSTIFLYILIVGAVTTITRPEGFLQRHSTRYTTKGTMGSIALLALVALAFLLSLILTKSFGFGTTIGVGLPFIGMLLGRTFLRKQFE